MTDDGQPSLRAPHGWTLAVRRLATAGTLQHRCRPLVAAWHREELHMTRPAKIASAQILQEVQRAAVRQGYEPLVCTYFETLHSRGELVDGRHGQIAGWVVLLEAAGDRDDALRLSTY